MAIPQSEPDGCVSRRSTVVAHYRCLLASNVPFSFRTLLASVQVPDSEVADSFNCPRVGQPGYIRARCRDSEKRGQNTKRRAHLERSVKTAGSEVGGGTEGNTGRTEGGVAAECDGEGSSRTDKLDEAPWL